MPSPTTTSPATTVPASTVLTTDALLSLAKWGTGGAGTGVNITYSFPTASAVWDSSYDGYEPDWHGYRGFTAAEQTAFTTALSSFSAVANITFTQVSDTASSVGDIRVAFSGEVGDEGALGWAYYPTNEGPWSGDIWFDPDQQMSSYLNAGGFGMEVLIHEIGHALGLKHPFDADGGLPTMPTQYDATFYTVMSYTESSHWYDWGNPSTPMVYDIAALQYLYGANMTYHTGNDTYFLKDNGNTYAIWDAGGIDMLDASQLHQGITINLTDGSTSLYGDNQAIGIAFGADIENFKSSNYADTITGNDLNNTFWVDSADVVYGSDGDDTYIVTGIAAGDMWYKLVGNDNGFDIVQAYCSVNLPSTKSVEAVYLMGTAALDFIGGDGNDVVYGNSGANRLDGRQGLDTLTGGLGNDTYVLSLSDQSDTLIEYAGEGIDTVESAFDYVLGDNFENLALTFFSTTGTGNGADNLISGNGLGFSSHLFGMGGNDTLKGAGGNDILDGGSGNDTLNGGLGNDTYIVDSAGDVVVESSSSNADNIDTVESSATWKLSDNVDHLKLTGSVNINGTGNALANEITGNESDNILDGGIGNDVLTGNGGNDTLIGGIGNDVMKGGAGNDIYWVDSVDDTANEEANADTDDEVRTTILITSIVTNIEHYTFSGSVNWTFSGTSDANNISGGSGNDTLGGNAGKDKLFGNAGNDQLDGGADDDVLDGGTGNDWLAGGDGNDTYVVDSIGDSTVELGSDSDDQVKSTVTYTLTSGLEHLTLLGTTAIDGIGNSAANKITGNDGANILDGKGGADELSGGKGNDTYVVDDAGDRVDEALTNAAGGGIDTVKTSVDFDMSDDTNGIHTTLDNVILTASAHTVTGNDLANNISAAGMTTAVTLLGGEGNDILTGGSGPGFDFLNGEEGADTMIGGAGNDIYIVDNTGDKVIETIANSAGGGDVDQINVFNMSYSLANLANIENLMLNSAGDFTAIGNAGKNVISALGGVAGNKTLDGAAGDDTIYGGQGNDMLIGGLGNDTLKGGYGNDVYIVDSLDDTVSEEIYTDSNDEIRTSVPIAAAVSQIEHYTYTGSKAWVFTGTTADNKISGGSGIDKLTGGAGNDQLFGNAGNDELDGGADNDLLDGGAGNDALDGGAGNDTYVVDSIGDKVTDSAGTNDLVKSTVTYTLASGLEHLTLLGAGAVNGTGNGAANKITGNDGANILEGLGGADELVGGKGNDTYIIDADDKVNEDISNTLGGGIDTVKISADFDMSKDSDGVHSNIDNAILLAGATDVKGNLLNNIINGSGLVADLTLSGGGGNDALTGGTGNDALTGDSGIDTLVGGKGDDTYYVNLTLSGATLKLEDTITEGANAGYDKIILNGALAPATVMTLLVGANFEALDASGTGTTKLNLTGNAVANVLIGNAADNVVDGGAANDILEGGLGNDRLIGGLGNDTLEGGDGNDVYVIDSVADIVHEFGTDTDDEVITSALLTSVSLYDEVEHFTYTGGLIWDFTATDADNKLSGGSGIDKLHGGLGNDRLYGNAGNDQLFGDDDDDLLDGGVGSDMLDGGSGNDTYVIDSLGDKIIDSAGTDDLVKSTVTYTLASGLERMTLLGTSAINGTGNSVANKITGNDGANILDGQGGADELAGGKGNDTYVVNDAGDMVDETLTNALGGGIDMVKTSVDFDMSDDINGIRSTLDNAILMAGAVAVTGNGLNNIITGAGLTADLTLSGGGGNDTLTGGSGHDTLTGGSGLDTLIGGKGDDTYHVNLILSGAMAKFEDTVSEVASAGTDTIELHGSVALATATTLILGANLENLDASNTGSTKLNLTGNALHNVLTGNDAANTLDGSTGDDVLNGGDGGDKLIGGVGNDTLWGGDGVDILTGGAGRDHFVFRDASEGGAGETITDFAKGANGDLLDLSDLLDGVSDPFGDGYVRFEQSGADTKVFYDADGSGVGAELQLVLLKNVTLTEGDTTNYLL